MTDHVSQYFNPVSSDEEEQDEEQSFLAQSPNQTNVNNSIDWKDAKLNNGYTKIVKKGTNGNTNGHAVNNKKQEGDNQNKQWYEQFCIILTFLGSLALLLLLCIFLIQVFKTQEIQHQYELQMKQPIVKPITDNKEYKTLLLQNNLKVLLISDKDTKSSYASMDINAGSWVEPSEVPGLAHYLEHMLFLANEKYPETAYFDSFLSKNGGYSNAYTTDLNTNFIFHVDTNAFEQALDIFSNMFISPIFVREQGEKEAQNVESEYLLDLNQDGWMIQNLVSLQCKPEHPMSRFTIGTVDTLINNSKQQNIDVIESLQKFFNEKYSANVMGLVVYSNQSLQELEQMVENSTFEKIKNTKINQPDITQFGLPFKQDSINSLIKIQTYSGQQTLTIVIQQEGVKYYKKRALEYIFNMLNNQGENSFQDIMKKENLINEMGYGIMHNDKALLTFQVQFILTDNGLENPDKLINYFYTYLQKIYDEGIQEVIYNDLKIQSENQFQYQINQDGSGNFDDKISQYSSYINTYSIPEVLIQDFIYDDFDKGYIKELLQDIIEKNNSFFILGSDQFFVPQDEDENSDGKLEDEQELAIQELEQYNILNNVRNLVQVKEIQEQEDELLNNEDIFSEYQQIDQEEQQLEEREQNQQQQQDQSEQDNEQIQILDNITFQELYPDFKSDMTYTQNNLYDIKYQQVQLNDNIITKFKKSDPQLYEKLQFQKQNSFMPENKQLVDLCQNTDQQSQQQQEIFLGSDYIQSILKEQYLEYQNLEEVDQLQESFQTEYISYIYNQNIQNNTDGEQQQLQQVNLKQYEMYTQDYFKKFVFMPFLYKNKDVDSNSQLSKQECDLLQEIYLQQRQEPQLINKNTFYLMDTSYMTPYISLNIQLITNNKDQSAYSQILQKITGEIISQILQQELAEPMSVDYNFSISTLFSGYVVVLEGWSDKFFEFVQLFLKGFQNLQDHIDDQVFQLSQNIILEQINQSYQDDALHQAFSNSLHYFLVKPSFTFEEQIQAADGVTLGDILEYLEQIKQDFTVKQLISGNIKPYDAHVLSKLITSTFQSAQFQEEEQQQELIEEEIQYQDGELQQNQQQFKVQQNQFLFQKDKSVFVKQLKNNQSFALREYLDGNEENQNSATINYYQYGIRNLESYVHMHLLVDLLNSHVYSYLRTERKLGYVAFSMIVSHGCIDGFVIGVEGATASPKEVDYYIEQSLLEFENSLKEISEEEFENIKQSIKQKFLEKKHSLSEQQKYYFEFIQDETYAFDLNKQSIPLIENSSIEDLYSIFFKIFRDDIGKVSIQRYSKAVQDNSQQVLEISNEPLEQRKSYSNSIQVVITDNDKLQEVQEQLLDYDCSLQE